MKLTKDLLVELAKTFEDTNTRNELKEFERKWLMYEGKTKPVIAEAILKEFKKPETVLELMSRLVPLNIPKKIINKLAGVYKEAPSRTVSNKDATDNDNLNKLEDCLEINIRMKEANRFFKLNKKALVEIYLDDFGKPSLRVVPAHNFHCFSYQTKKKANPNIIVKIDWVTEELTWWSDESHWVTDMKGEVLNDKMTVMNNPEGENPFKFLPFEFINESSSTVNPLQDDDLLSVSIAIPVLLTDLLFGLKYQCWAIIWTVGKVGNIPFNPNSVIELEFGDDGQAPSINQIKPEIDSDKMLTVVMALVSLLLTTKNLSAGTISDQITAATAASGIAKILDSAESVEDKKDQQAYFLKAEQGIWTKLKEMMKYWKQYNLLNNEINFLLPDDFAVNVVFQEPSPLMTEKEKIENSKLKLEAKLTTLKRELQNHYPDLDNDAIEELYLEIMQEEQLKIAMVEKAKKDLEGANEQV